MYKKWHGDNDVSQQSQTLKSEMRENEMAQTTKEKDKNEKMRLKMRQNEDNGENNVT